jgi:NAD(P)-dependent dehydrogenase (short-subunit alcohol dehydrogenase family)
VSLLSLLRPAGPNGFGYGSTAEEVTAGLELTGKTYLVTGANSGIGQESMRVLRLRGATVYGAGRSVERMAKPCADVGALPIACDLSDPNSVRACVAQLEKDGVKLDGVLCNAGIMALPTLSQVCGYEAQFFTNHIGHFLLVTSLLPTLARNARIVVVSSNAHRRVPPGGIDFDNLTGEGGYDPWQAYGQSKLANLLFVRYLAQLIQGTDQTTYALHPGVIKTNITRSSKFTELAFGIAAPLVLKTIEQGAATQCYLLTHPAVSREQSGGYFSHCNPANCYRYGDDLALAARLWEVSEGIVSKL